MALRSRIHHALKNWSAVGHLFASPDALTARQSYPQILPDVALGCYGDPVP